MSSLLKPFASLFRVGKSRYFIGRDLQGNSYFEYPSLSGSSDPRHTRRLIEYRIKKDISEYDSTVLPVQWKMWLRHTRRAAPTIEELETDRQRILDLQYNVQLIEARDAEAKERAEMRRLEGHADAMASSQRQGELSQSFSTPMPNLGEAPDQGQAQAEALSRAGPAADRLQEQTGEAASSSTVTPSPPKVPRGRGRIAAVPTSDVSDEGVQEARRRRVPISISRPDSNAETPEGQRLAGTVLEEREADNDVWKASKERIQRQDRGEQVESSGGRRSYSTLIARAGLMSTRHYSTSMRLSVPAKPQRPGQHHSSNNLTSTEIDEMLAAPRIQLRPSPKRKTFAQTVAEAPPWWGAVAAALVLISLGYSVYALPADLFKLSIFEKWAASKRKLSPDAWVPLEILRSVLALSPSRLEESGDGKHKLLTLGLPGSAKDAAADVIEPLSISSLSVKQPDIMIERSYTPLQTPLHAELEGKVDILVKKYENGEMGRYLHSLQPGQDQIEVRGWLKTWDDSVMEGHGKAPLDEIVFIAGGTGISPAYQLLSSILASSRADLDPPQPARPMPPPSTTSPIEQQTSLPRFTLLYAAPSPSSLLLLPELKALQEAHPERLSIQLWTEQRAADNTSDTAEESSLPAVVAKLGRLIPNLPGLGPKEIEGLPLHTGRLSLNDLKKRLPYPSTESTKRRAILIAGPEAMVESIAGPSRTADGQRQGPLGGHLKQIDGVKQGEVWKL